MTVCSVLIFGIAFALNSPLEPEILKALNRLRADPAAYVATLREQRRHYRGNLLEIPGRIDLRTQEGVRPLDEAIVELESLHTNVGRVALSAGLSRAAFDHVTETGRRGLVDHSNFSEENRPVRNVVGRDRGRYQLWSKRGPRGRFRPYRRRRSSGPGPSEESSRPALALCRDRLRIPAHARCGTMCVLDFALRATGTAKASVDTRVSMRLARVRAPRYLTLLIHLRIGLVTLVSAVLGAITSEMWLWSLNVT